MEKTKEYTNEEAKDGKAKYLAHCRSLAAHNFAENNMLVIYVRRRRAKSTVKTTCEDRKTIMSLLEIFPRMSEKSYIAYAKSAGRPHPNIDVFRTVRSVMRANNSPLMGVAVAFKSGGDIKIGWSLCNLSKNDRFNEHDGIRRAIDRAEPLPLIRNQLSATRAALDSGCEYIGPKVELIPHTCVYYVERIIERAVKKFTVRANG